MEHANASPIVGIVDGITCNSTRIAANIPLSYGTRTLHRSAAFWMTFVFVSVHATPRVYRDPGARGCYIDRRHVE